MSGSTGATGATGGVSSDAASGMAQFAAQSKQTQADEMAFEELKDKEGFKNEVAKSDPRQA